MLQKARTGCTTSSIFYLKTQAGWRETAAVEHSGSTTIAHEGAGRAALTAVLDRIAERTQRIGVADAGALSAPERDHAGP